MGPCYKRYVNSLPTLTSGIKGNSCLWHNRVLWGCKLICLSRRVDFLTNVPEILAVFHTHIACLSQVGITPKPKPWLKQPKFLVGHEKMRQYRCDFRFITYPAPCQYSWWTSWAPFFVLTQWKLRNQSYEADILYYSTRCGGITSPTTHTKGYWQCAGISEIYKYSFHFP